MQLKPENYRKEFCHQLKVLLSRYRNEFFLTNDFDKNTYFQTLRYIHFSCEVNVNDKCNSCDNDIIDEYAFERNPLADKDTCLCQVLHGVHLAAAELFYPPAAFLCLRWRPHETAKPNGPLTPSRSTRTGAPSSWSSSQLLIIRGWRPPTR